MITKAEISRNLSKLLRNLNLEILSQKPLPNIAEKATSFEFSRLEIRSSTTSTSEGKSHSIRSSTRCSSQMRSLRTLEMVRKVRSHNRSSKVDLFRVCNLQARPVGNPRIDFTPLLEYAQFVTRSPRADYYKRRGKWVVITDKAATHLNPSWKGRLRQASMEVDQCCHKRRIRCTRAIMRSLKHLPLLQTMLDLKRSRSLTAPPLQVTLQISNSRYSNKTRLSRPRTRNRIRKS